MESFDQPTLVRTPMTNILTTRKFLTFSSWLRSSFIEGKKGHLLNYPSKEPDFLDVGKTSDSSMQACDCQAIEYENWGPDGKTDSILAVHLINCNKIRTLTLKSR
jgi:hypothetical protein